jgi:hypothetical protein
MHATEWKQAHILSEVPGRLRVHLPRWDGEQPERIEAQLLLTPGVDVVKANPLTGNVLIHFNNPRQTKTSAILASLPQSPRPESTDNDEALALGLPALPLVRAGVRGVLGHAVVDAAWFGASFLGRRFGLPLVTWLGPLHVLADLVVWGAAAASVAGSTPAPARV